MSELIKVRDCQIPFQNSFQEKKSMSESAKLFEIDLFIIVFGFEISDQIL